MTDFDIDRNFDPEGLGLVCDLCGNTFNEQKVVFIGGGPVWSHGNCLSAWRMEVDILVAEGKLTMPVMAGGVTVGGLQDDP